MLVLIITLALLESIFKFHLTVAQHSASYLLGEDVTLTCHPSKLVAVDCSNNNVYWQYNSTHSEETPKRISYCGSMLANRGNRISVDISGNAYNLHIADVRAGDAGNYTCVTYSSASRDDVLLIVELSVYEPKCSTLDVSSLIVGNDVSLRCSLSMYRSLQWIAPNGTVLASRHESDPISQLILNFTAQQEDNYEPYICVATSESGSYHPYCTLTPLKQPIVQITPLVYHAKPGDDVLFYCDAELGFYQGPDRYNYTWFQGGVIVQQGVRVASFTLRDIQATHNATRIQCRASYYGAGEMASSDAVVYVPNAVVEPESVTKIPKYDMVRVLDFINDFTILEKHRKEVNAQVPHVMSLFRTYPLYGVYPFTN